MADGVSAENKDRMVITYGGYGDSKEIVLKNHAKTKRNQVLVAPALWTGCDLKDEQARFLIVLKTPYAYLGDERIKIKTERSQSWYTWQALMKLLQGMGRGVRSDKDYCRIYCMDSSTLTLLRMGRKLLPKAYQDILEVMAYDMSSFDDYEMENRPMQQNKKKYLYLDCMNKAIHGDCLEIIPKIKPNSIDLDIVIHHSISAMIWKRGDANLKILGMVWKVI